VFALAKEGVTRKKAPKSRKKAPKSSLLLKAQQ